MRPASSKPVEAAAVAHRAGMFARARPGCRARARAWEHGVAVGSAPSAARRRLLVASLGVGEPLPAQSTLGEEAVALEVDEHDVNSSIVSAEDLPPADAAVPEAKTVHVKFVLKKQCAFGQQFLVVGDDAALGLWDPAKATPLNWSEEHVWTAKTDLPANRLIEFKFLLRDASGNVRWQHGDNRTLQTIETPNTMVVHEDWDHAMKQTVSEEEELSVVGEDVMFSDDVAGSNSEDVSGRNGAVVADNPQTDENLETDKLAAVVNADAADAHLQGETIVADKLAAVVDADVPDAPLQGETIVANRTNQPQLMVDKGPEELRGEQNGTPSSSSNDDDDDDTVLCQERDLLANRSTSILENDLAWAGKAMQQMLRKLGFQIGTST